MDSISKLGVLLGFLGPFYVPCDADDPAGDHPVQHKPPTAISHFSVTSSPNPVDNILMVMRLWTWQKKGFDLTDKNRRVESLKNSFFLKGVDDPKHFKQVYTKLHETLRTSQFNWYFTEESEAKNQTSHLQWFDRDCMLWEVKVPSGEVVFKTVCRFTWGRLLNISAISFRQLTCDWERLSKYDESLIEKWKQNFHDFWKDKSEEELWDALFLEKCVDGCTDILLCHPLDDSWVVRNPIKEGKWWEMLNVNASRTPLHNSPLPCDGCFGREASKTKYVQDRPGRR